MYMIHYITQLMPGRDGNICFEIVSDVFTLGLRDVFRLGTPVTIQKPDMCHRRHLIFVGGPE